MTTTARDLLRCLGLAIGLWGAGAGCSSEFLCQPLCRTPAGTVMAATDRVKVYAGNLEEANTKCPQESAAKAACKFGATLVSCSCYAPSAAALSQEPEVR